MNLNPLNFKIFLTGSLIASSVGVVAIRVISENGIEKSKETTTRLTQSYREFGDVDPKINDPDEKIVTSQQSDSHEEVNNTPHVRGIIETKKRCDIYVVEKPTLSGIGGKVKSLPGVYKMKDRKEEDGFLEKLSESNKEFIRNIDEKGCIGGRERIYVYQDKTNSLGIYDEDLQGNDGIEEKNTSVKRFFDDSSFK